MKIRDWPTAERPREKLLAHGPATLSDAELLAIFLGTGSRGRNALELARVLLDRHGGLRALVNAEQRSFCATPGLGATRYARLQALMEIARRQLAEPLSRGQPLSDPAAARAVLHSQLRDHPYEVFACLWLDNRHRMISLDELFRGTINGASVHPREVLRMALRRNAAAVILAHNHPSGIAEPSAADCRITETLRDALGLIDTRVLDHIVVGDGETVSFAERGLL